MTARPMTETPPTVAQRSVPQAEQFVGQGAACDPPLDDDAREWAIRRAGRAMEGWYSRYEASGKKDTGALAQAVRCQGHMATLIRGCSAAQVARMERERGLA